uniref:Photosystem I assembly protein ycf3 n=1 Tax=Toxarium undulatum TaxID=210620 RepID=A0A1D8D9G9_9STRA|nr:photosystem I assembly protein ycf3 [Toxarium undulatum]AOS86598.1 photosystem I assembly protein ycf3 [Toxarium undulatum]
MANFFDRVFTIITDILIKILPISKRDKKSYSYYRAGLLAQDEGRYSEALENYYEALQFDESPEDRSYILYNIGTIYGQSGQLSKALDYYHHALQLNPKSHQALHNIGLIFHAQGMMALGMKNKKVNPDFDNIEYRELAVLFFDKASEYWRQTIKIAPTNYPKIQNWLKVTGRLTDDE